MESTRPLNVTRRVEMTGGLLGALSGESQGKALERVLPELNAEGYRVVFVLKDQWNVFKKLFFLLVLIVTLGIYSSGPHHQDSGEAKIRESTAGVSRKPSSDCKACGCSSKHLCGLTAWNT